MFIRTTCGLFAACVLSLAAPVTFSDSFEGPTFDPFWTVTQSFGTVSTSTDLAFSGSQSAKFASSSGGQRSMHLEHTFAEPIKGLFSVRFYDYAPGSETLYMSFGLTNSSQPSWNTDVGAKDFDAFCYAASAAGTGPNGSCGIYPQLSTTTVARTAGWRLFEINVGGSDIKIYIDGTLVHTALGDFSFDGVSLNVFGPSWRPNTLVYFDDFSVDGYTASQVPEPGTLSSLALGAAALAALRRRRNRRH